MSNTFTLLDTSQDQVFLFIENKDVKTPLGNLYKSDMKGRIFTLSMSNIIKGTAIDFEKIFSLDGTFLINRYNGQAPVSIVEAEDLDDSRPPQVDLR